MKCRNCGADMHQTEKDTSSGRDIREYECLKCGHSDWADQAKRCGRFCPTGGKEAKRRSGENQSCIGQFSRLPP